MYTGSRYPDRRAVQGARRNRARLTPKERRRLFVRRLRIFFGARPLHIPPTSRAHATCRPVPVATPTVSVATPIVPVATPTVPEATPTVPVATLTVPSATPTAAAPPCTCFLFAPCQAAYYRNAAAAPAVRQLGRC